MKRFLLAAAVLAAVLVVVGCADKPAPAPETAPPPPPPSMITGVAADHPELDEQEMIMACSDCHREVTPELTEEWWNSAHGIGNVKCYQCHGTYENMMVIPAQSNCEICHMDKASDPVKGLAWRKSHPAHSFQGGVR